MCGRYALELSGVELASILGIESGAAEGWAPSWNVAPTTVAPVVIGREGAPMLETLRWGMSSRISDGRPLFNARVETVDRKPTFREAIRARRVAIPINAFYEWRHRGGARQPYAIRPCVGGIVLLAGIWNPPRHDTRVDDAGFCVLTTEATSPVAEVHDRMPVLLDAESASMWISSDSDRDWRAPLEEVVPPRLTLHPVSRRVNGVFHDGPELLRAIELPEDDSASLFADLETPEEST